MDVQGIWNFDIIVLFRYLNLNLLRIFGADLFVFPVFVMNCKNQFFILRFAISFVDIETGGWLLLDPNGKPLPLLN